LNYDSSDYYEDYDFRIIVHPLISLIIVQDNHKTPQPSPKTPINHKTLDNYIYICYSLSKIKGGKMEKVAVIMGIVAIGLDFFLMAIGVPSEFVTIIVIILGVIVVSGIEPKETNK